MATINMAVGGDKALNNLKGNNAFVLEKKIDCSKKVAAAGDIFEIINIPANTLVEYVYTKIEQKEDSTATIDIGDNGSATRYNSNMDVKTPANGSVICGDGGDGSTTKPRDPVFYTAADKIKIRFDHDCDKLIAVVKVFCRNAIDTDLKAN